MKQVGRGWALAISLLAATPVMAVDVQKYLAKDKFEDLKISPNGDYYAATVPLEDRTVLVILRRSNNTLSAHFGLGRNTHVSGFNWVNPERLVISIDEKLGALDTPQPTGEIYAINADGSKSDILIGQRVQGAGLGTKIQPKKVERVAAFLIDDLPADDRHVIVSVMPFSDDPYTRVERLDVYTGRRTQLSSAPVRNADFITDNAGVVRFANGAGTDNVRKLFYRAGDGAEWKLISNEAGGDRHQRPIGFSGDNRIAYLEVEQAQGPNAIVALDTTTMARKEVLRDDDTDPSGFIYRNGTGIPVGAFFVDGKPRTAFLDDAAPEAKLYRLLANSFPGETAVLTSRTADGKLALVQVSSDRNPGDFFLFDTDEKKASHVLSRSAWIDPKGMAEMRPVSLSARDGLKLHGYITVPNGSNGKSLPMIVMPHGGPFGVQDVWGFDTEVQMLAQAGYAVLQLNFRGSAGYGYAYTKAGARQWGLTMQDDLTDATRWAIKEGIADANRICIYGASYGGYASLMGVAKEPGLYRCAAGYVGVYDLPTMHTEGDIQRRGSGETYIREWIGERERLVETSPNRIANRIKVPVFLAAGGRDERAPIAHSKMMEQALRKAGVPVETLYYDTEGHGFYVEKNKVEYYTRLLAFLSRHLGGKVATVPAGGSSSTAK